MTKIEKANAILKDYTEELKSKIENCSMTKEEIVEELDGLKPYMEELKVFECPEIQEKINNIPAEITAKVIEQTQVMWPEFEKAYETQDVDLINNVVAKSIEMSKGNFEMAGIKLEEKVYTAMRIIGMSSMVLLKRLGITAKEMYVRNMQFAAC